MITSDKQLKVTLAQIQTLKDALAEGPAEGTSEALKKIYLESKLSLLNKLNSEVEEYEHFKKIKPTEIEVHSFSDLRLLPIRYRIAAHLTQQAFATLVDVNLRQIARYEEEGYENLNVSTLETIIRKLPISINGYVKG